MLDEPEQLRRERRLRAAAPGRRGADARGHLDDVVVGQPGERAVVAHVDHVDRAVAGRQRGDEPGRRLAVERAAALLEQRRLLGRAPGRGTSRAARARSRPPRRARRRAVALLGEHLVVRVEVAQVVGRARRRARRAAGAAARAARRARRRGRPAALAARPRRRAARARTQVRWLSPTWSTTTRAGLDAEQPRRRAAGSRSPRCTGRPRGGRASSSARVTMPTGFVKSTIQAPGAARSAHRARRSRAPPAPCAAPWRSPPAPVVSCPMQPQASGIVSSRSRAAWPPTRIWISTKSAPSSARVEVAGERQRAREAGAVEHPPREPADDLAPLASMSCSTSSSHGRAPTSPDTSSGV